MDIKLFNQQTYIQRRNTLMKNLGKGSILLLGNRESSINFADNWYPFRQDSTFLYYAGLNLPDISILLDCAKGEATLFGDELNIDDIIWTGPLPSLKELAESVGIKNVLPSLQLQNYIDKTAHFLPPYKPEHILKLSELFGSRCDSELKSSEALIEAIVAQRNIKSEEEIQSLHEACNFTKNMHYELMSKAKEGMYEYELVSMAKAYGASNNVNFSFLPICTTRGHVLHNHSYGNKINNGDMVLFDGGLESSLLYAGDMTRTFPVNNTFSNIQRDLYQIVLNAQKKAISVSKIGVRFLDVHLAAAEILMEGLTSLGICKGDPKEAVKKGAHTMFFQCGLGHLMGLDVHDMENLGEQYVGYGKGMVKSKEFGLKSLRLGRPLEEGYVITIEPGIYIIPELIDKFHSENKFTDFINYSELNKIRNFGGIRIEDDFIVRKGGLELLGDPLAKEIKDVENIRTAANS